MNNEQRRDEQAPVKLERLVEVVTRRQDSIERIQKLQHDEIARLLAALQALQGAFDALTGANPAQKN